LFLCSKGETDNILADFLAFIAILSILFGINPIIYSCNFKGFVFVKFISEYQQAEQN